LKSILVEYHKDIARIWSCSDSRDDLSERMRLLVVLLQHEMSSVETALSTV
jgi:Trp operon repressor